MTTIVDNVFIPRLAELEWVILTNVSVKRYYIFRNPGLKTVSQCDKTTKNVRVESGGGVEGRGLSQGTLGTNQTFGSVEE